MRFRFVAGLVMFLSFFFLCVSTSKVYAQATTASIGGTITDPSGAAVPSANVDIRALATGRVLTTKSNSTGLYNFQNLQAGVYELTVKASGFKTYVQSGIVLSLASHATADVALSVGETRQTVQVSANASPLTFTSAVQKGTINPESLTTLPLILNGITRSAVAFVNLLPGVTQGGGSNSKNFATRINGGVNESDEAIWDGTTIIDGSLGQNGIELAVTGHPMSPDAIQEITELTSNFDPRFGSTSGAVLTVVTKSGTDKYHGNVYEYAHNTALNARSFGIGDRPKDIENDFGGDIGGPLGKDVPLLSKLFYSGKKKSYGFVNYELFRITGGVTSPRYTVPTPQERQGDFSDWKDANGNLIPIYDPATSVVQPDGTITRQQFMGCDGQHPNVICSSDPRLSSSLAQNWLKYVPSPNLPGVENNFTPPTPPVSSVARYSTVLDVRGDMYYGNRDHFEVTVHYYGIYGPTSTVFPVQIAFEGLRDPNWDYHNTVTWDHTFRPNVINTFNFGYNNIKSVGQCLDYGQAGAVPNIPGVLSNDLPPRISFGGPYAGFGCNSLFETTRPADIYNDLLMWSHGSHTFRFGGELRFLRDKEANTGNQSGTFSFSPASTGLRGVNSGNAMASFLLGYVDSASMYVPTVQTQFIRQKYWALYASDTWKINSKLTMNYGVRYDVSRPSREKFNKVSFIDPYKSNPGANGLPGALVFAGNYAGDASFGAPIPESTWYGGVSPRIGVAYALNSKNVIRAGYGIFIQMLEYPSWSSGVSGGRDGFNTNAVFNSPDGLTPVFLLQDGFPQNYQKPPFLDLTFDNGKYPGLYRQFNGNRPPYTQQWNLTVEHEFDPNNYVSLAYVGNKGTRLMSGMVPLNYLNPSYLSMGNALYDNFAPGQASLDGVSAPYPGWAQQLTDAGQCPPSVAQALMPFPQFCGNVNPINENAGNSTFNSFQMKLEHRISNGFWAMASYTWSKFISSGSDIQVFATVGTAGGGRINPTQRQRNKSLDAHDVPQSLSLSAMYQLPFGRGKHFLNHGGVVNALVGGWQVTPIFRAQSGTPFTFYGAPCNVPSQFYMSCLPGVLPGASPYLQSASNGSFNPNQPLFDQNAFETNFQFYGGAGSRVSNLRGFPFFNTDITMEKDIHINERLYFTIGAQFFNAWNQHSFQADTTWGGSSGIGTTVGDPLFGRWVAVTSPRNIQLYGRFTF